MLMSAFKMKYEEKHMITEWIEENKLTLLHGESGSGKTTLILKHLNENDIIPILADFDDNNTEELDSIGVKCIPHDGEMFLKYLLYDDENGKTDVTRIREHYLGAVIVIDTWRLFVNTLYKGDETNAHKALERVSKMGYTFIILSHTNVFSGKEPVPDVEPDVFRHMKARLYLRRTTLKRSIEYDLLVEKLRGYNGVKIRNVRKETDSE